MGCHHPNWLSHFSRWFFNHQPDIYWGCNPWAGNPHEPAKTTQENLDCSRQGVTASAWSRHRNWEATPNSPPENCPSISMLGVTNSMKFPDLVRFRPNCLVEFRNSSYFPLVYPRWTPLRHSPRLPTFVSATELRVLLRQWKHQCWNPWTRKNHRQAYHRLEARKHSVFPGICSLNHFYSFLSNLKS